MALSVSHSMGEFDTKATPIESISVKDGFEVDLLFTVPKEKLGSWVNLCLDNKNRIIASDQFGGLYRFKSLRMETRSRKVISRKFLLISVPPMVSFGHLTAFMLRSTITKKRWRVESTGSRTPTETTNLIRLKNCGACRHAVIMASMLILLGPDKKSIYLITGNNTTQWKQTVPECRWIGEKIICFRECQMVEDIIESDSLLPGIIYKISPDGKDWEIVSSGYRNIFDGGFNSDGELFTYDADMEYDFNTPWYRPTRICHVTSGSMYGWRNGTGKRPEFYSGHSCLPSSILVPVLQLV